MSIQNVRTVFHKGRDQSLDWHSDDGCFHCGGLMDDDADDLVKRLDEADAAWRAANPGGLPLSERPVRSAFGSPIGRRR